MRLTQSRLFSRRWWLCIGVSGIGAYVSTLRSAHARMVRVAARFGAAW